MTSAKSINVPIPQPLQLGEVYNQPGPISLWPKLLGEKQVLFPNSPETGRTETRAALAGLLLQLQRLSQKTVEPGDDQGEIRFWVFFFALDQAIVEAKTTSQNFQFYDTTNSIYT